MSNELSNIETEELTSEIQNTEPQRNNISTNESPASPVTSILQPLKQDNIRPNLEIDKTDSLYHQLDNLNDLAELRRLERRSIVTDTMRNSHYLLAEMDTTFARRLSGIMIRNSNPDTAWELFKSLHASSTNQQEIQGNLEKFDFVNIWGRCREKLVEEDSNIYSAVYKRSHFEATTEGKKRKGQILWNDFYELNQNPRRTLEMIRKSGVIIELPIEYIESLRENRKSIEMTGSCPILEHIKNEKIFSISGLRGSKASLTIHDLFDHYWTYDLMEKEGLFYRYKDFFESVGNPQNTDMFKRESELIASTVFGTRLYRIAEEDFEPIFGIEQIINILEKSKSTGSFSDNQHRALSILTQLYPDSYEAKCLSYDVSNMAIELMEQRRKHGFIKNLVRNEEGVLQPLSVMKILDPEYLALMTELVHTLLDTKYNADTALSNISIIVEDYLVRISNSSFREEVKPLIVKIEDINKFDVSNCQLNENRIKWLRENVGFASTKSYLC